jgi:hypothetical protein
MQVKAATRPILMLLLVGAVTATPMAIPQPIRNEKMKPLHASPSGKQRGRRRWGRAQLSGVGDPYKAPKKRREPAFCPQCGAVLRQGRWSWSSKPAGAHAEVCQACHRINDRYPAGLVTLAGQIVGQHGAEMIRLARHQEETEKAEHPLNRIIDVQDEGGQIVITTTDIHLARRIGEAQKRAFRGTLELSYDKDSYFVRVNWRAAE